MANSIVKIGKQRYQGNLQNCKFGKRLFLRDNVNRVELTLIETDSERQSRLLAKFLESEGACDSGIGFAAQYGTLEEAWNNCDRVDFFAWAVDKLHCEESYFARLHLWAAKNIKIDGKTQWEQLTPAVRATVTKAIKEDTRLRSKVSGEVILGDAMFSWFLYSALESDDFLCKPSLAPTQRKLYCEKIRQVFRKPFKDFIASIIWDEVDD